MLSWPAGYLSHGELMLESWRKRHAVVCELMDKMLEPGRLLDRKLAEEAAARKAKAREYNQRKKQSR